MDIGGIDIILGVVWLETLGKVIMDWKMFMNFVKNGREIKLCNSAICQRNSDAVVEPRPYAT